jgi:hypothetical protein
LTIISLTDIACAFQGLTLVILPFTKVQQVPPTVPEDHIAMLKLAKPDVLILPAGLAVEEVRQGVPSLKGVVVLDISTSPHMDWKDESDNTVTQTWTDLLKTKAKYDLPQTLPPVAIQSFVPNADGFDPVEFSHQVNSLR